MLHRNPEAQVSLERTCRVRSGTSRVFGWQNRQCPFAKGLTFVVRMPADYQNQAAPTLPSPQQVAGMLANLGQTLLSQ
jgi:hypothetical protein